MSVVFLNGTGASDQKTVVIIGNARGGTSAVAGMLLELGLEMPNASSLIHEWSPIQEAEKNHAALKQIAASYNSKFRTWGWKYPEDVFSIERFSHVFRNLHIIIVFRDLLEVAKSAANNERMPVEAVLPEVLDLQPAFRRIITYAAHPIALVSYGDLSRTPRDIATSLRTWLQLEPDEQRLEHAINFVSSRSYKEAVRRHRDSPAEALQQDDMAGTQVSIERGDKVPSGASDPRDAVRRDYTTEEVDSANIRIGVYRNRISEFSDSLKALRRDVVNAENHVDYLLDKVILLLKEKHPAVLNLLGEQSYRWLHSTLSDHADLNSQAHADNISMEADLITGKMSVADKETIVYLSNIMLHIHNLARKDYHLMALRRQSLQRDMEDLDEVLSRVGGKL